MSVWSRFVKVNVAGTDVTADALDGVTVSNGGRTWWDQNVGGYARITLFDESPNVTIGDAVTVEVESPEAGHATGGTITEIVVNGIEYYVHRFTSSGTFTITESNLDVEYLVVGGGGSGADYGGGGGGGVREGTVTLGPGTYTVTVGAGGASGAGNSGQASVFDTISAAGGGGGGNFNPSVAAKNGGSGGGGPTRDGGAASLAGGLGNTPPTVPVQGYDGGAGRNGSPYTSGGGGGAGQVGGAATATNSGNGGAGRTSSITGIAVTYGGGGGGGTFAGIRGLGGSGGGGNGRRNTPTLAGSAGANNLGGGGGGFGSGTGAGYAGGSGVVIVRYPNPAARLFTGTVSTIETQLTTAGPFWTIEATGPLATANRRVLLDTIPADTDGDQILALALKALGTQWAGTPGAWDEQTFTWAQFAPDTSEIDTPGVYALAAITDTPSNVGDQLALAASSGQGWLYETPHGTLGYGDSTRRETTPADDFITIPGNAVDLTSISAVVTDGDLVNRAIVTWSGGEQTLNYTPSQTIYGLWERNYETTLDDAGDALAYGLRRVELDGQPRKTLPTGIRVDLRLLDDTTLDHLLAVRRNYGIIVEDMPTYLTPEGVFRGFVEGYTWTLGPLYPTLDLFLSDYALSVFGLRWAATGTVAWQDVAGTVTWADTEETL